MISPIALEDMQEELVEKFKTFLAAEPPAVNGDTLLDLWDAVYNEDVRNTIVETTTGPSHDVTNRVFPYEKLQAVVKDGGNWKYPRMWQRMDELERRGGAYREGELHNFEQPNKAPGLVPQKVLIVGGGPVGLRMSIEMRMGGHFVTIMEKRREVKDASGELTQLGFTNRINRPHNWPFVRNDLAKLNGKDWMSRQACYPVFTEPDTSSIGIDEAQILLMKNALMLGVDFRLGAGFVNAKPRSDPQTMRAYWQVDASYDTIAQGQFGKGATDKEDFDMLIGCDGPRSTVRDTQAKFFGNIEKRKFMDCIGIVANVQKCKRNRLKELGFEYGQEPSDMNRSHQVFKPFFAEILEKTNIELENIIYYKASFHNYIILTPKKKNLEQHGLGGPVYTFGQGRDPAVQAEKNKQKAALKAYCSKAIVAAGIPIDNQMSNEGFVGAPNDCMSFDFAECWNTKKSMHFNVAPPGYDVDVDGEWMGSRIVPFIALAGDALLEPFWPQGLGLKRGWQAIMDTCYAADNLFNKDCLCARLGKDPATWTWDEHFEGFTEQVARNFELCNRLQVAEEMGAGRYDAKTPVMMQMKKLAPTLEEPTFEVEIDPWTRYAPLARDSNENEKYSTKNKDFLVHPRVSRELKKQEFYKASQAGKKKDQDWKYDGRPLISINGKVVGGKKAAGAAAKAAAAAPVSPARPSLEKRKSVLSGIPAGDIAKASADKSEKLTDAVMSTNIEAHIRKSVSANQGNVIDPRAGMAALLQGRNPEALAQARAHQEIAAYQDHIETTQKGGDNEGSAAAAAEAMWDRGRGKHLDSSQEAELGKIQNMIQVLLNRIGEFKQREQAILNLKPVPGQSMASVSAVMAPELPVPMSAATAPLAPPVPKRAQPDSTEKRGSVMRNSISAMPLGFAEMAATEERKSLGSAGPTVPFDPPKRGSVTSPTTFVEAPSGTHDGSRDSQFARARRSLQGFRDPVGAVAANPSLACSNFRVDLAGANYGDCKCGQPKAEHSEDAISKRTSTTGLITAHFQTTEIIVEGAGMESVNGLYKQKLGAFQGNRPVYVHTENPNHKVQWDTGREWWIVDDIEGDAPYKLAGRHDMKVPLNGDWSTYQNGAKPAPSVRAV